MRQESTASPEQERLVGRAAALGDEQELVAVFVVFLALGIDLDLRGMLFAVFFSSNMESGASCE